MWTLPAEIGKARVKDKDLAMGTRGEKDEEVMLLRRTRSVPGDAARKVKTAMAQDRKQW
jgi:hypothetical protein